MFIVIDKITNKKKRVVNKNYGIQINEDELLYEITDKSLMDKTDSAYDYTLIIDSNGCVTDITINKTMEQYYQEQSQLPKETSQEEVLSQTVANLTLQNADLQNQLQTLSQTIAQMQIS